MNLRLRTLGVAAGLTAAAFSSAVDVYGVTVNATGGTVNLVRFNSATPGSVTTLGLISGTATNDRLVGLDFRSNGGSLYALGLSGNLYTIDKSNGNVLSTVALTGATLSGNSFGVDFNPTVDRLRIVSSSGQNLRVNVDTGAVTVDTRLAYDPADANAFQQANIVAVGYTNNTLGGPNPQTPTRTTALYDLDSSLDSLAQQTNANGGVLSTRGPLGVNSSNLSDMDIYTNASGTNFAYAAINVVGGASNFYSLNTTTGAATLVGAIGGSRVSLIAAQPVPEPASMIALGLGAAAFLRRRRASK